MPVAPLRLAELVARWEALAQDETTPDRFELTEFGELVLSPLPSNTHQWLSSLLGKLIVARWGGLCIQEFAVLTDIGVRVPDLVWIPEDRMLYFRDASPAEVCPPLAVEVSSPGNRPGELQRKAEAYLRAGAREVLILELDGTMAFLTGDGRSATSSVGLQIEWPAGTFDR